MATIPRTQPRAIQGRAVPMGAQLSTAPEQAMAGIGSTLRDTGADLMAQETRQRLAEFEHQQQVQEAAAKQQDMLQLQGTQQRLRELHDEIGEQVNSGAIPAASAEQVWRERSGKLTGEGLSAVREGYRTSAQTQLTQLDGTLSRSLGRTVVKRQQGEIGAGLTQSLEQWQRDYLAEPGKGAAIQAKVLESLQTLGPTAGWSPEKIAATGQLWKERTQYTQAHTALSAGRNDPAALAQAEKLIGTLPDLDPQKRSELLDKAQVYRLQHQQQAELRASRAERENERRLKHAEAEFQTFQALADKGTVLDPAYVDRVQRATAGTPYQQGIVRLAQQAVLTGGLAAQPVDAQRAALQALDAEIATRGRTPELDARRQQVQKVLTGAEADIKADPLTAALERGVVARIEPLNLQGGIQGLAQQLQQRSLLADTAATWAGRPVSPLTSTEAQSVAQLLSSMPADQKATGLQLLASQMTPAQAQALAKQLDSKDRALGLALAYGAARTTEGRPTSELILKGQEALKAKTIKMDDSAESGMTAQIDVELRGAITNPEQLEMARDAAKLIWAGYSADSGRRMSIPGAVRLAVGGDIVQRNGSKVIIPAGVTEDAFEQHLEKYPAQALQSQLPDGKVYVRGQPVEAAEFLASLPTAPLRTVGRGRYAVLAGGAVATNAQGRPIMVEAPGAR